MAISLKEGFRSEVVLSQTHLPVREAFSAAVQMVVVVGSLHGSLFLILAQ